MKSNTENPNMGRVTVPVLIEAADDLYRAHRGEITAEAVRRVDVPDALIDTGAMGLFMPRKFIDDLGLIPLRSKRSMTTGGVRDTQIFGPVRLTIQGRDCICDVGELAEGCPVLIGQVPLELLDFLVDPAGRRLIANPAHGSEQMIELF